MNTVWIVDDDQSIRWVLEKALAREHLNCRSFNNPNDVLDALEKSKPDVIVSDIRMPRGSGIHLLQQLKVDYPQIPVIVMTAYSDLDSAVAAFQGGAFEYLTKPFDIQEAMDLIHRALSERLGSEKSKQTKLAAQSSLVHTPEMIGQAPSMQEVFRAIGRLSQSNAIVLITGESGTGKELVAKALHRHSSRAKGQFVSVNLSSIPDDLFESELFGHERGAFPSAQSLRRGRFEQADGGTLFLDEIGDLPLPVQAKLLRVLEDGQFYRLGGQDLIRANVRIIASTHHNLESKVAEGSFRDDLYHRLNVIRLRIPALRERAEDIPLLAKYFLATSAKNLGIEPKTFSEKALDKLMHARFPGNVRQLQSVCHWLTVMASSKTIQLSDLPKDIDDLTGIQKEFQASSEKSISYPVAVDIPHSEKTSSSGWEQILRQQAKKMLDENQENIFKNLQDRFEKALIQAALETTRGRKVEAAERLGIGRNTITRKLQELDIEE